MKYIHITYTTGQTLSIEGFGPNTLIGAVADVLDGNYDRPDEREIVSITLSNDPQPA